LLKWFINELFLDKQNYLARARIKMIKILDYSSGPELNQFMSIKARL